MTDLSELMVRAQGRPVIAAPVVAAMPVPPSTATDDTLRLLQTVLPSSGGYLMGSGGMGQPFRHSRHESAAALAAALREASARGDNVYFAVASFRPDAKVSRKAEHVDRVRSLFLDLDVGKANTNSYAAEGELECALAAFCADLGVAPTAVVHSGAGRHVYWALEEDLSREQWLPLATMLKDYSRAWGLRADPAVTADAARVLRAPGTMNPKHGQVAALLQLGARVSVDVMRAGLERVRVAAGARSVRVDTAAGGLDATSLPETLRGVMGDGALSSGLPSRHDWLQGLPAERQIQLLDEMMAACPAACWSDEPWWAQVVHAVATLQGLPQDIRLDLLVKHSARSLKWAADGWDRDRLFREKWRSANGTASLSTLLQTAEQHGWVRPMGATIPVRFADRDALVGYLVGTYVYAAEQGAYLNRKTRALLSPESVAEAESWRVPVDGEKSINLRTVLRTAREVERVDTIGYAPGEGAIYVRGARRIANTYRPWTPAPMDPLPQEMDLLKAFLDHLTPDEEGRAFRRWIWMALAWLVQRPGARLPVAVLLTGAPGCGKSTLLETFPRLLFGLDNVTSVTAGELESPFNDWLGGARILTMPELRMGSARDARRVADALKPIITGSTVRVHPKGAKGYEQENVVSLLASSNHGDAVHLEDDDRRWVVYESPADNLLDDLASRLYAFLEGQRGAGVLTAIFRAVDVSTFNPHALPAVSSAKRSMIAASRNDMQDELIRRFEGRERPFDRPLFTVEGCKAVLLEAGVELRGNSAQAIARVLKERPIAATELGRFRVSTCSYLQGQRIHALPRLKVYVARRDDPERWRQTDEEFIRRTLASQSEATASRIGALGKGDA